MEANLSDLLLPPELLVLVGALIAVSVLTSIMTYFYWEKIPPQTRGMMIFININSYIVAIILYVLLKLFVA